MGRYLGRSKIRLSFMDEICAKFPVPFLSEIHILFFSLANLRNVGNLV